MNVARMNCGPGKWRLVAYLNMNTLHSSVHLPGGSTIILVGYMLAEDQLPMYYYNVMWTKFVLLLSKHTSVCFSACMHVHVAVAIMQAFNWIE